MQTEIIMKKAQRMLRRGRVFTITLKKLARSLKASFKSLFMDKRRRMRKDRRGAQSRKNLSRLLFT
jgi:hypothetical protein